MRAVYKSAVSVGVSCALLVIVPGAIGCDGPVETGSGIRAELPVRVAQFSPNGKLLGKEKGSELLNKGKKRGQNDL